MISKKTIEHGTAVYMETHTAVTNANGLLTLQVGGGNVQQGVFAEIDWANGLYFLKTETDPNGGTNYSITSTQQLLSVPYALYSREAGNGFSGDYNDLVNTPDIPVVPTNVSAFTNDAGYITMDSVPAIPTNVGAFNNDAGYITMDSVPRPFLWSQLRPRSCAVSVPHSALAGWRFRLAGAFARVAI